MDTNSQQQTRALTDSENDAAEPVQETITTDPATEIEPLPQRIMSRALIVDAFERRARLIEDSFEVSLMLKTLAAERAIKAELVWSVTAVLVAVDSNASRGGNLARKIDAENPLTVKALRAALARAREEGK